MGFRDLSLLRVKLDMMNQEVFVVKSFIALVTFENSLHVSVVDLQTLEGEERNICLAVIAIFL